MSGNVLQDLTHYFKNLKYLNFAKMAKPLLSKMRCKPFILNSFFYVSIFRAILKKRNFWSIHLRRNVPGVVSSAQNFAFLCQN